MTQRINTDHCHSDACRSDMGCLCPCARCARPRSMTAHPRCPAREDFCHAEGCKFCAAIRDAVAEAETRLRATLGTMGAAAIAKEREVCLKGCAGIVFNLWRDFEGACIDPDVERAASARAQALCKRAAEKMQAIREARS